MEDVMGGSPESPIAGVVVDDGKPADASTSPKRRRGVTKRVVTVPISEVEGTRLKGEGAPPADSWAWRKYGQKPIKGSPYPRGYYRCSSSKGCPARKQVERSRADPSMLVVTYASDHNHSSPATRSSPTSSPAAAAAAAPAADDDGKPPEAAAPSGEDDDKFAADLGDGLLPDEFGWFAEPRADLTLHSPIWEGDGGVVVQMGEEDESLFADLGELPECSVVFRRCEGVRRRGLAAAAPWCGSTG